MATALNFVIMTTDLHVMEVYTKINYSQEYIITCFKSFNQPLCRGKGI
jgi:hypothetical protein